MASSYNVSTGTGNVLISSEDSTYFALQLVADATLDADITYKLQQSEDGVNFHDISNTSGTLLSGGDSSSIETYSANLKGLYLYIDVGSATTGTVDIFISDKKKVGEDIQDVSVTNTPLDVSFDPTSIDAFGRFRVSQLTTQADLKQIYDALPYFYDIEEIGTGVHTYNAGESDSSMTTSANSDMVIMQTKQRFNYLTGKSAYLFITFRNFNTESNVEKRIGYFNTSTSSPFTSGRDGFYLENNKGTIRFVIAKNGTGSAYNQDTWDDPMDGTGASGVDLQLGTETGNLLMWADYEWLGVGQVRFGFVYEGQFIIANKVDFIGEDGVYMLSPNHSLRAEIRQTGAGSGTLRLICATYNTEGALNEIGVIGSENLGVTHVNANIIGTAYALLGIRLNSSKLDSFVDIIKGSVLSISNKDILWEIWLNPTVAGTFTYNAITDSVVEIAKGAAGGTNTVTGGTLLDSGYAIGQITEAFKFVNANRLGAAIDGTRDEIVLTGTPLASNSDVLASITWRERT